MRSIAKQTGRWLLMAGLLLMQSNASPVLAADSFPGNWKMNPAKGHITGQVYKILPAGDSAYRFDNGSGSPTFVPADGRPQTVSIRRYGLPQEDERSDVSVRTQKKYGIQKDDDRSRRRYEMG
jgi:hypothetical protein